MLSGDNGVLQRATDAKTKSDEAQIRERIRFAYNSALTKDITNQNGGVQKSTLENELKNEFPNKTIEISDSTDKKEWIITIDGVTESVPIGKVNDILWMKYEDGTIGRADKTVMGLKIGDTINYIATEGLDITDTSVMEITSYQTDNGYSDQTIKLSDYTNTWRLLGVENGKLLIVANKGIGVSSNSNYYYLKGRTGYQNAESELKKISELFGRGKYAERARSIAVEDINKITGYDPNAEGIKNPTAEQITSGNKYNKGNIGEYGNEVIYSWDGTEKPKYTSTNGKNGNLTQSHNNSSYGNGFFWYDGNEWKKSAYTTTPSKITSLTFNNYFYYPETLSPSSNTAATIGIAHNSSEYNMLFNKTYWLASKYISTNGDGVIFGVRTVEVSRYTGGYVSGTTLAYSNGMVSSTTGLSVLPVVYLKSDIALEKDGSGVWQFK